MIGNNSISLLTDAWMKGIRTICPEKALEAMIHQTEARHTGISSVGRDGFGYYDRLGYVPYPEVHEATAKTLEYAYTDWCVARFADSIGRKEIADTYYRKALNYRNLYYPDYGFMWAKMPMGNGETLLTRRNGEALSRRAVPGTGRGVFFMIPKACLD